MDHRGIRSKAGFGIIGGSFVVLLVADHGSHQCYMLHLLGDEIQSAADLDSGHTGFDGSRITTEFRVGVWVKCFQLAGATLHPEYDYGLRRGASGGRLGGAGQGPCQGCQPGHASDSRCAQECSSVPVIDTATSSGKRQGFIHW